MVYDPYITYIFLLWKKLVKEIYGFHIALILLLPFSQLF